MLSSDEKAFSQKPSRGVIIFAVLFLASSLMHIQKLVQDRDVYFYYYSYLPSWLMLDRYAFSWFQRLVGILIGLGLLARKDLARKAAIILGIFSILTVYWKHPYPAFKIHAQYLSQQLGQVLRPFGVVPPEAWEQAVWPAIILHSLGDIIFCGSLIYFLTRPSVKKQFGKL